ncbi:MAG TPA: succinate dehydrogenase assembly factor 2 family protein [Gammaproteobacteria bacterium]|nr:succinate dehydrogenase assembly factor 2 family protein [Gammaproteobacteria bacterium]
MSSPPTDEELRRLRWQCRRGMLELDEMLLGYLERRYPDADVAERRAFQRLLQAQDPELQRWLLLEQRPADAELCRLVEAIKRG